MQYQRLAPWFKSWLDEDPLHLQMLLQAQWVREKNIREMANGPAEHKIWSMHRALIEGATGVKLADLCLAETKEELWGAQDCLPDTTTHAELVDQLKNLVQRLGSWRVSQALGVSRETTNNWMQNRVWPSKDGLLNILEVVLKARNGEDPPDVGPPPSKDAALVPHVTDTHFRPLPRVVSPHQEPIAQPLVENEELFGGIMSGFHATHRQLKFVKRLNAGVIERWQQHEVLRLIASLFETCEITVESIGSISETQPLTKEDLRALGLAGVLKKGK